MKIPNEKKYERIWCLIQLLIGLPMTIIGYFVVWPMLVLLFILGLFLMLKGLVEFILLMIKKK